MFRDWVSGTEAGEAQGWEETREKEEQMEAWSDFSPAGFLQAGMPLQWVVTVTARGRSIQLYKRVYRGFK